MAQNLENAILHRLTEMSTAMSHGTRIAFVQHENRVYWATDTQRSHEPTSPVVKLLQGVFERHRDLSFFILRKRLFLNYEPGPMDVGFMDLLAKRFSVIEAITEPLIAESALEFICMNPHNESYVELKDREQSLTFSCATINGADEALKALAELEGQVVRGEVLHDHRRPIAAILTDASGRVMAWSLHAGDINKSLHAEIVLLQNLFKHQKEKELPDQLQLFVSLSPCRMCGGTIFECFGDRIQVYYKDLDTGRMGTGTAITQRLRPIR